MSEYLDRAEQLIQQAAKNIDKVKGPCNKCRWMGKPESVHTLCLHPAVEIAGSTVNQGYDRKRAMACDSQRSNKSNLYPIVCGPNGELFQEKDEPPPTLLDVIKNWFKG